MEQIIENATQIWLVEGKRYMKAFLKGNVISGNLTDDEADEIEEAIDEYYTDLLKEEVGA